jgi:two-component system response regulator ChvI
MQLIVDGRKGQGGEEAQPSEGETVTHGPLHLNLEACRALWRGTRLDLTLTEFRIVHLMATKAGCEVTYREIYDLARGAGFIAGYGTAGYRSNVRAFIKRIRQKFKSIDADFDRIENYPGFGYRWRPLDA